MLCENCGKIGGECICNNSDESDSMSEMEERREDVKTPKRTTEKKDQTPVTTEKHSPDTKISTTNSESQAENGEVEETDEEESTRKVNKKKNKTKAQLYYLFARNILGR